VSGQIELGELIREALLERLEGHYAAAERLLQRATGRFPAAPEPYRYLGQTLSYRAAASEKPGPEKDRMIARALELLGTAERLQGGASPDSLHDRGWIEDEKGNYGVASDLYRKAIALAENEARRRNPVFFYNLGCALAKDGKLTEAIAALAELRGDDAFVATMRKDPDLVPLQSLPEFRQLAGLD
jgi:tetratricopeptide (TPR) repeat protein